MRHRQCRCGLWRKGGEGEKRDVAVEGGLGMGDESDVGDGFAGEGAGSVRTDHGARAGDGETACWVLAHWGQKELDMYWDGRRMSTSDRVEGIQGQA